MNKKLTYQSNAFFDEYITNNSSPRKGFKRSIGFFNSLTGSQKIYFKKLCESSISSMGVTFFTGASYRMESEYTVGFTMTKKFHNIAVPYFGGAGGDPRIAAFCLLPL